MERFLRPNSLEVQNQKRHILHARGGTIVFSRAEIILKVLKTWYFLYCVMPMGVLGERGY